MEPALWLCPASLVPPGQGFYEREMRCRSRATAGVALPEVAEQEEARTRPVLW